MGIHCNVTPIADAGEWSTLFSRVDHPHMVQSWAYGEAKQTCGGWRGRRDVLDVGGWRTHRLVFERGGEPVAICQLLAKSFGRIRLASRLNRGPLFLDAAIDDDAVKDVFQTLRSQRRRLCGGLLVLAPALPADLKHYRMLCELGFHDRHRRGWRSAYVDLRLDEECLRANLTHKWRNRLRAAEGSGLRIALSQSHESLEWMVDRHVENMREKSFSGPSPALLRALYAAAPDDVFVFQACLDERAVGGMLIYRFGRGAECFVSWYGQEARAVNAGNLVLWETILAMRRRGCHRLDLGGYMEGSGFTAFKRGVSGVDYELLNEWVAL